MQLCAILTNADVASIVEQITPLRVTLRPRRVISLDRPTKVELVAGAGLRLSKSPQAARRHRSPSIATSCRHRYAPRSSRSLRVDGAAATGAAGEPVISQCIRVSVAPKKMIWLDR